MNKIPKTIDETKIKENLKEATKAIHTNDVAQKSSIMATIYKWWSSKKKRKPKIVNVMTKQP